MCLLNSLLIIDSDIPNINLDNCFPASMCAENCLVNHPHFNDFQNIRFASQVENLRFPFSNTEFSTDLKQKWKLILNKFNLMNSISVHLSAASHTSKFFNIDLSTDKLICRIKNPNYKVVIMHSIEEIPFFNYTINDLTISPNNEVPNLIKKSDWKNIDKSYDKLENSQKSFDVT